MSPRPCQHSGIYRDTLRSAGARPGQMRSDTDMPTKNIKRELMVMTGWIKRGVKKACMKSACDTHARGMCGEWKRGTRTHTSCSENSWRGCRRVHKGEEAGKEGGREEGMSSASHLDCQTLGVRLGIVQRQPDTNCLNCTLNFTPLWLFHLFSSKSLRLPQSILHAFCRRIRGGKSSMWACVAVLVFVWNKLGVDHSAQQRKGNESADSRKKRQALSNSTGGLGRSKERQEERWVNVCVFCPLWSCTLSCGCKGRRMRVYTAFWSLAKGYQQLFKCKIGKF